MRIRSNWDIFWGIICWFIFVLTESSSAAATVHRWTVSDFTTQRNPPFCGLSWAINDYFIRLYVYISYLSCKLLYSNNRGYCDCDPVITCSETALPLRSSKITNGNLISLMKELMGNCWYWTYMQQLEDGSVLLGYTEREKWITL